MNSSHLELLVEINNTAFAQNVEWFNNDIRVYYRPRNLKMNLGYTGSKTIQITFNSGTDWIDFASSKKFDFHEQILLIINPDDLVNFRCTDTAGLTIQHTHVYVH